MEITDKVKITGLQVEAIIGFYTWERNETQPLIVDLALGTSFNQVFKSDSLKHTIDYSAVSLDIKQICQKTRFFLIEALAKAILSHVFNHYPVSNIHLSIRKPLALPGATASVECYRTRKQMEVT